MVSSVKFLNVSVYQKKPMSTAKAVVHKQTDEQEN
jgi:hypothetical protein